MSRVCPVSHRRVASGNNVSHANNRVKRRFLPNLQQCSLFSQKLSTVVKVRLSTRGMRMIEKLGGLDAYLSSSKLSDLDSVFHSVKKSYDKVTASTK